MRKSITVLLIGALFAGHTAHALTVVPSSSGTLLVTQNGNCISLTDNLLPGAQGTTVTLVQQFLRNQGHFSYPENSGYFGTQTRDAVIAFQLAQGLITSKTQLGAGNVGPATIARIKQLTCAEPTAKALSKGLAKIDSTATYADQVRGVLKYRYTVSINPPQDTKSWRIRLICDEDQITTNRRDLKTCGESMEIKSTTSGKETFSIQYTNGSRANQLLGIIAEALDSDKRVIDTVEKIDYIAAAGIRDLEPNPGEGYTRITFTGGTSTAALVTTTTTPTRSATSKCSVEEYKKLRTIWTREYVAPLATQPNVSVNVFALAEGNITRKAHTLSSNVEIVEPNGRTIMEIVEAYKNTHYFPDIAYVKFLNEQGAIYNKEKTWTSFAVPNETKLEQIRAGIKKIIPLMPSPIIDKTRIASNDAILVLGELYEAQGNTNTSFSIPTVKWNWGGSEGRVGGQYAQQFFIQNGRIIASTTYDCGPLSNASYDIILIRK